MNTEVLNARKLQPNGERLRVAYNAALQMFRNAPDNTPILPATLRSEAILGTQQQIVWEFTAQAPNPGNAGVVRSSENRLTLEDAFMITDLAIMFGNELTAGTTPGQVLMQTWENPAAVAVLPLTVGGFGANASAILEAYNGLLDLLVDSVQYMRGMDALRFKRVDTAQAGTLLFTASNQAQSFFKSDEVFTPITPFVNITGRSDVKLTLNMPDSTAFTGVANNRVIAAAFLRGLRIQNGAKYL